MRAARFQTEPNYLLAADVGEDQTTVAVFRAQLGALRRVHSSRWTTREHGSLEDVLEAVLDGFSDPIDAACVGVAGQVVAGRATLGSARWSVDAARLLERLPVPEIALINELEASAWALDQIRGSGLTLLKEGMADPGGNVALLAAGATLGEAVLLRSSTHPVSLASEGGHSDFAPRSALEIELLQWLAARHGHVSYEHVLSAGGLRDVHAFLRETGRGEDPAGFQSEVHEPDAAARIAAAGRGGRSTRCAQALELFIAVLGSAAGSLALRSRPSRGVYIGGPVARAVFGDAGPAWMARARALFRASFVAKGRLRPALETVPAFLIVDDGAALLGAAHVALRAVLARPRC